MYDIGDVVKIKEDFMKHRYSEFSEGGADPGVVIDMLAFAGIYTKIKKIRKKAPTPSYILEDANCWDWDERWLEPFKIISIDEEAQMEVFHSV